MFEETLRKRTCLKESETSSQTSLKHSMKQNTNGVSINMAAIKHGSPRREALNGRLPHKLGSNRLEASAKHVLSDSQHVMLDTINQSFQMLICTFLNRRLALLLVL